MVSIEQSPPQAAELKQHYAELKAAQPKLRIRDAARQLGVSEMQLLALDCGDTVQRLEVSDWNQLVNELKPLGHVMVLTRNEHCVHERSGHYETISGHGGAIGLVTGKDIDLRLFYKSWKHAFAVTLQSGERTLRSIQVFDPAGEAIHKVYLKDDGDLDAYQALVQRYLSEDQGTSQAVEPAPEREADPAPLDEAAQAAFLDAWSALKDTHDYFILLKKHKVSRLQAMSYAEGRFTRKMKDGTARQMLELASERQVPIMVFVGNEGAIQIHSGPVNKIAAFGEWINVLDPEFNLHLDQSGIASSWIVEKPTEDGTVTSLEVFNAEGGLIVQFFGARKPGIPEREDWRALINDLKA